jgi:hypothetical protein
MLLTALLRASLSRGIRIVSHQILSRRKMFCNLAEKVMQAFVNLSGRPCPSSSASSTCHEPPRKLDHGLFVKVQRSCLSLSSLWPLTQFTSVGGISSGRLYSGKLYFSFGKLPAIVHLRCGRKLKYLAFLTASSILARSACLWIYQIMSTVGVSVPPKAEGVLGACVMITSALVRD